MNGWHKGLLILVIAYVIGALFPAPVQWVRGKIGV